jgi:hypothetical protein
MFKYGCSDKTFDKYLKLNVSDATRLEELPRSPKTPVFGLRISNYSYRIFFAKKTIFMARPAEITGTNRT